MTRAVHPPRPVDGLGQRLLHVQRHEHRVHLGVPAGGPPRGWLYTATARRVVPALRHLALPARAGGRGELLGDGDPSLYVRFPLLGRDGEALVVWTTTPWTLPANVAAAVKSGCRVRAHEDGGWVAERSSRRDVRERALGSSSSGSSTRARSTTARAGGRRPPGHPVGRRLAREGTGIVHIAPGCGAEDFELSRVHDLPVVAPIDEAGRMLPPTSATSRGSRRPRSRDPSSRRCASAVCSSRRDGSSTAIRSAGAARRRSSSASSTTGSSRRDEIRQPMLDANATVEWTPA